MPDDQEIYLFGASCNQNHNSAQVLCQVNAHSQWDHGDPTAESTRWVHPVEQAMAQQPLFSAL